eukprot:TRINITY_DN13317_c0_g1_i2.p1 TRINITY_DN13317_c0_g1~~TRINITY_DN13317_c0_g1_i2.p1  ORF type:complete len:323 (-),score=38.19 TRINITY_DN13317_c0_g1_i2:250-1218(-)
MCIRDSINAEYGEYRTQTMAMIRVRRTVSHLSPAPAAEFKPSTADLTALVAVVTGGAANIGLAIAHRLADNGAAVVIVDWNASGAQSAAEKLQSKGYDAMWLQADVSDADAMQGVARAVKQRFGKLDILINNAGVNVQGDDSRRPVDTFRREDWDRILRVDLTGLFVASQALVPLMLNGLESRPDHAKRIVNISSVAGVVPLRLQSAFVAAKAGVVNLTKSMALELGPRGITTNVVCPGSVLTEGTKQLFYGSSEERGSAYAGVSQGSPAQRMLEHVPLARPGTSDEIAHAVLMLVAPDANYINGANIIVDGGWTCGYHRDF